MKRRINLRVPSGLPAALLLGVMGVIVTACGGSDSESNAPRLSNIQPQTVNQDTPTAPIAFTVSDKGSVDAVTLTATSSNGTVIAPSDIAFGGSGASRTITLVPSEDAVGTSTITITATNANGFMNVTAFAVNVQAVTQSFTTLVNTTYAKMEGDTPTPVKGVTYTQDADETTFVPLLQ